MNIQSALDSLLGQLAVTQQNAECKCNARFAEASRLIPVSVQSLPELRQAIGCFHACLFLGLHAEEFSPQQRSSFGLTHYEQIWPQLAKIYTSENGLYRIFQGGHEGGRREFLLNLLQASIATEIHLQNQSGLNRFIAGLWECSYQEREEITEYYFRRNGHLYPLDVQELTLEMRMVKLPDFLKHHASALAGLRVAFSQIR